MGFALGRADNGITARIGESLTAMKSTVDRRKGHDPIVMRGSSSLCVDLFGEWRSCDEVCEIWRCEPLNVSNAKISKNVVNRRHRFLTNDVAKASLKSVLECQPRKCGQDRLLFLPRDAIKTGAKDIHRDS